MFLSGEAGAAGHYFLLLRLASVLASALARVGLGVWPEVGLGLGLGSFLSLLGPLPHAPMTPRAKRRHCPEDHARALASSSLGCLILTLIMPSIPISHTYPFVNCLLGSRLKSYSVKHFLISPKVAMLSLFRLTTYFTHFGHSTNSLIFLLCSKMILVY